MPATLPGEADIPIAYGTSNTGMLKHVTAVAWPSAMARPCSASPAHYNYSLADGLWDVLDTEPGTTQDRSRGYIGLIRNFTRYSWLLMYLFGAAPALARDFLRGHEHPLQSLGDHTLYLPHATSLRMSDLGYQNKAQSQLKLCYNDLDTFLGRLFDAVTQPWPDYQKIGTHRDGQWIQLNTNVLQIENEYYSSIRPKRATGRCERPITALAERGVQYVRCLDIDPTRRSASRPRPAASSMPSCCSAPRPTAPTSPPAVIASAAPTTSPPSSEGRKPGLQLDREGQPVSLAQWGNELLDRIAPYAALYDSAGGDACLRAGRPARARRSRCHASARLLRELVDGGVSTTTAGPEPQARRDAARSRCPPRRPPPMSRRARLGRRADPHRAGRHGGFRHLCRPLPRRAQGAAQIRRIVRVLVRGAAMPAGGPVVRHTRRSYSCAASQPPCWPWPPAWPASPTPPRRPCKPWSRWT